MFPGKNPPFDTLSGPPDMNSEPNQANRTANQSSNYVESIGNEKTAPESKSKILVRGVICCRQIFRVLDTTLDFTLIYI